MILFTREAPEKVSPTVYRYRWAGLGLDNPDGVAPSTVLPFVRYVLLAGDNRIGHIRKKEVVDLKETGWEVTLTVGNLFLIERNYTLKPPRAPAVSMGPRRFGLQELRNGTLITLAPGDREEDIEAAVRSKPSRS